MKKYLTFLLIFLAFYARADQPIFGLNTSWKYLDNGSDQGTAWRQLSFNDASWATGNAELGYGDGDESTVISYGADPNNKHITTYFRKTFTIADTGAFTSFQIGVKRDDGVVVYVNGTEVWHDNISGVVTYTTLADADAADDGNDVYNATIPTSYFVNGDNVVAVEVHQFVANSSDLSFSLSLTGIEGLPPTNQEIFPLQSVWKYLDNGTDQGTAWRDSSFNDASWASGAGEFGYGDGDESTTVSYGSDPANKYITTYFRKSVSIADVSAFTSFQLGVKRDDGVVIYVNGIEVWRDNLTGTVLYNTYADYDAADDGDDVLTATIPTSYFVTGNNVIAAEVHQFVVNSSDLSFDMSLTGMGVTPPSVPVITRGAYLNVATPNSIIIRYRTDINTSSKIVYGTTPSIFTDSVTSQAGTTEHVVQLSGLQPNTKYYYAIKADSNLLQNDSTENFFITPPLAETVKPTRIWVLGDMGFGSVEQNQVRDAYYNYTGNTYTDLWLWLGDNAYNSGTDAEYQNYVFENRYEKMLRQTAVWPSAGNHDMYASDATTETGPYFEMFSFPTNGEAGGVPSGHKAYYSYNYANIHFVVLESNTASFRVNGGAMMNWLQSDLAANNQKWTVVYFHHAPYSKGSHDSDAESAMIEMRENFNPILEQYKVDLVLSGHSHNYERSFLMKGHFGYSNTFNNTFKVDSTGGVSTPYIKSASNNFDGTVYAVAGTGGIVEAVSSGWPHPAMYSYSETKYGSMVLDINGDTLKAKFIDNTLPNPQVYDQFEIIKQCDAVVTLDTFNSVCVGDSSFAMSGGVPSGGVYSGPGVSNGTFNPSVAGVGTHTITYTYTNGFCVNSDTSTITVTQLQATITPSVTQEICQGGSVQFSASSGNSYQWMKDGLPISGATGQTYVANGSGNYAVVVTTTCGTATSDSVTVNVTTLTVSVTPVGPVDVCSGSVTLTAGNGAGYSYQWKKDGVNMPGATGSTLSVTTAGNYTVVITNASGCTAQSNTVVATSGSTAITSNGSTEICAASTVTLSATTGTGITYQWYRNNVLISGATGANYTVSSHGTYHCYITVPQGSGCSGQSNSIVVTMINNPTPTIGANGPTVICDGSTVELTTNTYSGVTYEWEKNGSVIVGATGQTYTATTAGSYRVKQTANGCSKKSPGITVTTTPGPTAVITAGGSTSLCNGDSVTLTVGTVSGATYQWIKDGSAITGATAQNYTVSIAGDYQCSVTKGCTSVSNIITVTTGGNLQATITPSVAQEICQGGSVQFSASSGNSYQWMKDGLPIAGATGQTYVANGSGNYAVAVTTTCGTATSDSVTVNVTTLTVSVTPVGSVDVCSGSVTLTAGNGAGYSYQWKKDGVNMPGATDSTLSVTTAGNYTVVITNASGCTAQSNTVVATSGSTAITANGSTAICAASTVTLSAPTGTGITYQWYRNNVLISGATGANYTVSSHGTYHCYITVPQGSGCSGQSNSIVVTMINNPTPTIGANGPTVICDGSTVELTTNTYSGVTYEWEKNGSVIVGATGQTYTATTAGSYRVSQTANGCTKKSPGKTITTTPGPTAVITAGSSTSLCNGDSVTLTVVPVSGAMYQWIKDGSAITGATAQNYTVSIAGDYQCSVTKGCTAISNIITVTTGGNLQATITPSVAQEICQGGSVQFSASSGNSYQWMKDGLPIAGATGQTYVANGSGNYAVAVTTTCGTATSATVTVSEINITAHITANGSTEICPEGSVVLQADTGVGYSYQWMKDGIAIGGSTQYLIAASAAGNYSVMVTNTCGSLLSNTITVNVINPDTSVVPAGTTTVCSGASQVLSVILATGASYQWYRNNLAVSGATSSSYSATSSGSYYVKVNAGGCPERTSTIAVLNVQTNPTPSFTSSAGTTICIGSSTILTSNTYSGVTYQWQLNSVDITGATAQTYEATTSGTYRVKQTYNGCSRYSAKSKLTFVSCRIDGADENVTVNPTIKISPNPFNYYTVVELKGYASDADLVLYDILGKEILRLKTAEGYARIDRSDLVSGIYILKIIDGEGNTVARRLIAE